MHRNDLTVTVDVALLIAKLEANHAGHKAVVEKARAGFEREARIQLEKRLQQIRDGDLTAVQIFLPAVEDHSEDYERAIGMLKLHAAPMIVIGSEDYACYVEDRWGWKREWTASNDRYTGR